MMAAFEAKLLGNSIIPDEDARETARARALSDRLSTESEEEGGEESINLRDSARNNAIDELRIEEARLRARDPYGERAGGPSSGPKAVIADKRFHDKLEQKQSTRAQLERASAARGARVSATADAALLSILGHDSSDLPCATTHAAKLDDKDEEEEEEEGDDEFIQQYRATRLHQLQSLASAAAFLPSYCSCVDIQDVFDLPPLVDAVPSSTLCLLLIWDSFVQDCHPWVRAWQTLAASYPHTRWARLPSSIAGPGGSFDPIGLPSVVAYRGGKEVHVSVRPQDDMAGMGLLDTEAAGSAGSSSSLPSSSARTLAAALRTGNTEGGRRVTPTLVEAWLLAHGLVEEGRRVA